MTTNAYICNYTEKNTDMWLLTINEVYASQTDQSYKLASIDDLMDWVAATNQVLSTDIICTSDGFCKWVEEEYINQCGEMDWKCGFELI